MRKTRVAVIARGFRVTRRRTAGGTVAEARRLEVFVEVGFEGECLVALAAVVRFGGRVCLHVSAQIGTIGKRLAAMSAAVRFFARVRSHVTLKEPRP